MSYVRPLAASALLDLGRGLALPYGPAAAAAVGLPPLLPCLSQGRSRRHFKAARTRSLCSSQALTSLLIASAACSSSCRPATSCWVPTHSPVFAGSQRTHNLEVFRVGRPFASLAERQLLCSGQSLQNVAASMNQLIIDLRPTISAAVIGTPCVQCKQLFSLAPGKTYINKQHLCTRHYSCLLNAHQPVET